MSIKVLLCLLVMCYYSSLPAFSQVYKLEMPESDVFECLKILKENSELVRGGFYNQDSSIVNQFQKYYKDVCEEQNIFIKKLLNFNNSEPYGLNLQFSNLLFKFGKLIELYNTSSQGYLESNKKFNLLIREEIMAYSVLKRQIASGQLKLKEDTLTKYTIKE